MCNRLQFKKQHVHFPLSFAMAAENASIASMQGRKNGDNTKRRG